MMRLPDNPNLYLPIPYVVGLTGHAQNGKNTIGDVLVNLGYKMVGFADALKSMALVLDPIVYASDDPVDAGATERLSDWVEAGGWEGAKKNPEVRRFLQVLGTEGVRGHLGENAWVKALTDTLIPRQRYVVTDVRFPNEAAAITNMGGELWKVIRPNFESGVDAEHPSEAHVDSLPTIATFFNDGTVKQLQASVKRYVGARGRV